MKAISGLCCFRRDSPAASPELTGVWELTSKSSQGAAEEIKAQLSLCFSWCIEDLSLRGGRGFAQALLSAVLVFQLA